ncbi:MAG: 50S ribosomal protein L5, partial [Bdellovibrionota bacterium]
MADNKTEKGAEAADGISAEEKALRAAKSAAKKAAGEVAKAKNKKDKEGAGVKIAAEGQTRVSPKKPERLEQRYRTKVVPALMKQFNYKNPMQVPRITKIVVNCAVKEAVANPKLLDSTYEEIMAITGQKPVMTKARKAIAAFKVRAGNPV